MARVQGHLVALTTTLDEGQPLTYNKDNQEDKEPLFDTVDTITQTLIIYADMVGRHSRQGRSHARRRARRLCDGDRSRRLSGAQGVPFRDSHECVARA